MRAILLSGAFLLELNLVLQVYGMAGNSIDGELYREVAAEDIGRCAADSVRLIAVFFGSRLFLG